MYDNADADASVAIDNVVQALKLAGLDESVIADVLLAKGTILYLMNGLFLEETLDGLKVDIANFAKYISDKS